MRTRTAVAVVVLVAALAGAVFVGLSSDDAGTLAVAWTSQPAAGTAGNHHEPAVATVDDRPTVFAPLSSPRTADACALVALDATDGSERWRYEVPSRHCTIHSVADPTVADADADGDLEVLAATTEAELLALDPGDGTVTRRAPLTDYGYNRPTVTDLDDDGADETLVVDVSGAVRVFAPDGSLEWGVDHDAYVWANPVVADVDADGATEVVVADRRGRAVTYDANGSVLWNRSVGDDLTVTWMTAADLDDDPAVEYVVGTTAGAVVASDGATGDREWRFDATALSAVHAVVDVDGRPTVFATAADGSVVAIDGATGTVTWESSVTTEAVKMMPPPVAGDVDGDGAAELVVGSNDGTVAVYDPATGDLLASRSRDVDLLAHPVLADVDGDGRAELYVVYADGRVQRLTYEG
ncbi:PQQ-binding-like beta-propeller repeat protein [Haloarchaeobius sp. HRN-SO-5]|uniref:outer membrane protein assembly factor BamB family protein n=1 Tax=Haloarchaeobius sp. HRN-SO-5 TaxID=3446118 RepID=UPI003EB75BDE